MTEQYLALRELRFAVKGETIIVPAGDIVPAEAWAACTPRQVEAIRDPHQRKVARVTMP